MELFSLVGEGFLKQTFLCVFSQPSEEFCVWWCFGKNGLGSSFVFCFGEVVAEKGN